MYISCSPNVSFAHKSRAAVALMAANWVWEEREREKTVSVFASYFWSFIQQKQTPPPGKDIYTGKKKKKESRKVLAKTRSRLIIFGFKNVIFQPRKNACISDASLVNHLLCPVRKKASGVAIGKYIFSWKKRC